MKKILLIATAVALILTCSSCTDSPQKNPVDNTVVSTTTLATESKLTVSEESEFIYDQDKDGNFKTLYYDGSAEIVNVPKTYNGGSVVEIDGLLRGNENVVEVNIPDTVTKISGEVFEFCTKLERLTMGDNVQTIGTDLCLGDTSLKEVNLSKKLIEIPEGTFSNCSSLETITIPNKVKSIGNIAFSGCTTLKEIHMTDSVIFIADENTDRNQIFEGCNDLTIYAPKGSYAEKYAKTKDIPFVEE